MWSEEEETHSEEAPQSVGWRKTKIACALMISMMAGSAAGMMHGSATGVSMDRADHAGVEGTALPDLVVQEGETSWLSELVTKDGKCTSADKYKYCQYTSDGKLAPGFCDVRPRFRPTCRPEIFTAGNNFNMGMGSSFDDDDGWRRLGEAGLPAWFLARFTEKGDCKGKDDAYKHCLLNGKQPGNCNLQGTACRKVISTNRRLESVSADDLIQETGAAIPDVIQQAELPEWVLAHITKKGDCGGKADAFKYCVDRMKDGSKMPGLCTSTGINCRPRAGEGR